MSGGYPGWGWMERDWGIKPLRGIHDDNEYEQYCEGLVMIEEEMQKWQKKVKNARRLKLYFSSIANHLERIHSVFEGHILKYRQIKKMPW